MSGSVPMTNKGFKMLQQKLKKLKNQERPRILLELEKARDHGDLSENAEYHAAKEKYGFIKGHIEDIEGKLSRAQVIDISRLTGEKVVFGATVTMADVDDENAKEVTYQIVGEDEANVEQGKININSPIARALIGKSQYDWVKVRSPKGEREYEILEVKYIV